MSKMFLLQKFCRDLNSNLKEAYRKAVQESRGAVEEEEEDAAKADNKEQVIKIILRMVKLIVMKIVIRNEDCNTQCSCFFSEPWESQTEAGHCNEPRTKPGDSFNLISTSTINLISSILSRLLVYYQDDYLIVIVIQGVLFTGPPLKSLSMENLG